MKTTKQLLIGGPIRKSATEIVHPGTLALIMSVVTVLLVGFIVLMLYRSSIEEARLLLGDTAKGYANLIEAVVAFDTINSTDYPGGAREATLSQVQAAFQKFKAESTADVFHSQEVILGKQENDQILFIFRQHAKERFNGQSIPLNSKLAEPMRLAISGQSGTVIGKDYHDTDVLAAHEPLPGLGLGLVVKVDISEVRAPFVKASLISLLTAAVIIFLGVVIFMRLTVPLVKTFRQHSDLIESISKVQSLFITESNSAMVFGKLLTVILEITESEYGFVHSMEHGANKRKYLKALAISDIAWDKESQKLYNKMKLGGLRFYDFDLLFGDAATGGKVVISNYQPQDPRRKGTPDGHPAMDTFLAVPIMRGETVIGVIGVANRNSGYTLELVNKLKPLWSACSQLILAHKHRQEKQEVQIELINKNNDLSIALHELAKAVKENEALKQREKENIYRATVAGTQHILNNLLNQLKLVEMEIARNPNFNPDVARKFSLMTDQAGELVNKLSSVSEVEEQKIKDSVLPA